MSTAILIFPHQLFEHHPALTEGSQVYLIEEFLFFKQYNFHKQKLTFHRASMKAYERYLLDNGHTVHYIEASESTADVRHIFPFLKKQDVDQVQYCNPTDDYLEQRIVKHATQFQIKLVRFESPSFMLTTDQAHQYFSNQKKFFQADFYIHQRKHFNILMSGDARPEGGKWSFDAENRLKYPKGKKPPQVEFPPMNDYRAEAAEYIEKNFKDNYGTINRAFTFPIDFHESRNWLNQFLTKRFESFGAYEDAIVTKESILHHSVLTPMLNVGLLTPGDVIEETLAFASKNNMPLNSTEGFVRQIVGWREFIRGIYNEKGSHERTKNYWKFKRKIPKSFWNATTGIPPIDDTIRKVLDTGYCHHIERLMVLGNFMLLCEFDPDEVYQWFMELFIDAYDWVMVPNVYGMSQFADGGLMATKPYISGSNYLMKMSDIQKGEWQSIWDGLFWRFMHVHRDFFLSNPRLGMLIKTFDKMDEVKRERHLKIAEGFLTKLNQP